MASPPSTKSPLEPSSSSSAPSLKALLSVSKDKLLFITYTPSGTLRPRWYLVQIDMEHNSEHESNGTYFCTFLQKHPKDIDKFDDNARWWPEWRKISWNDDGTFEYGERMIFTPRSKPDPKKFIKFGDDLDLSDPSCLLVGPFYFSPPIGTSKSSSIVPLHAWQHLFQKCNDFYSLILPSLSSGIPLPSANVSHFRRSLPVSSSHDLLPHMSSSFYCSLVKQLVIAFWDCFDPDGIRRPILGFEFGIDTGNHTPVCCKKPSYGPHESKTIRKSLQVLLSNGWIEKCTEGGCGSPIVLAPKPHQEKITNIEDFVWRMRVSYRGLNRVTNPFEYPIGRCDVAIEDVGDGTGDFWFISLDSAQGYHQITVRKCDRKKLAFFTPDDSKYTFTVMPFGPRNAPSFFTAKTKVMHNEAMKLFRMLCNKVEVDLHQEISLQPNFIIPTLPYTDNYDDSCNKLILPNLLIDSEFIPVSCESPILYDITVIEKDCEENIVRHRMNKLDNEHVTGSRVIIDDLLLHSTSLSLLLLLFECYLRVYLKYRESLHLKKCDLFSERFEFVGHDILPNGNTTAR